MKLLSRKMYSKTPNLYKYLRLKNVKRDYLEVVSTIHNKYHVWYCEPNGKRYLVASAIDEPYELVVIELEQNEMIAPYVVKSFVDYDELNQFVEPFDIDEIDV